MPEVEKRGEWYRVTGRAKDGTAVSVDIPAPAVESRSRAEAEKLFARSIERMKDHQ